MFPIEPLTLSSSAILIGLFSCDNIPTPIVNVISKEDPIIFKYDKYSNELQNSFDIDTISPYAAHEKTKLGGLTSSNITIQTEFKISWSTNPILNKTCMWFDKINVTIKNSPTVYIAKEYKRNRCRRNTTLQHEMKHVNTDRDIIEEYLPMIKTTAARIGKISAPRKPIASKNIQSTKENIAKAINEALQEVSKKLEKTQRIRQQQIDTREEYDRLSRACSGPI